MNRLCCAVRTGDYKGNRCPLAVVPGTRGGGRNQARVESRTPTQGTGTGSGLPRSFARGVWRPDAGHSGGRKRRAGRHADDIREAVSQGDVLVIIASEEVDPRVVKLSRNLLADHLVKQWDLALVDLAVYRPRQGTAGKCVIVPSVRNLIESEPRQVVRVIVQGEKPSARVEIERIGVDEETSGHPKWTRKDFLTASERGGAASSS